MGALLLIPGIILLTVYAHWFNGQHDVGLVLVWAGALLIALQLLLVLFGGLAALFGRPRR